SASPIAGTGRPCAGGSRARPARAPPGRCRPLPYNPAAVSGSRRRSGRIDLGILASRVKRDDAFARRAAPWRGEVDRRREDAAAAIRLGGGEKAQAKQRAQGKMTARERVAALCDPGSPFLELGLWTAHGFYKEYGSAPAAGVVVGIGAVHGRDVVVVANDATV